MPTLELYKGFYRLTPTPTGLGGQALNSNFTKVADDLEDIATSVSDLSDDFFPVIGGNLTGDITFNDLESTFTIKTAGTLSSISTSNLTIGTGNSLDEPTGNLLFITGETLGLPGYVRFSPNGIEKLTINNTGIGFYGVTPAARAGTTTDIKDALTNYGLLQGTDATPLNLDGGALTAGDISGTNISGTTVLGNNLTRLIGVTFGDGSYLLAAGTKIRIPIPTNATITGWRILADASSTVDFIIRKAASPYTSFTNIVATDYPVLTAQSTNSGTALTGWTTSLSTNDMIEIEIRTLTSGPKQLTIWLNTLQA